MRYECTGGGSRDGDFVDLYEPTRVFVRVRRNPETPPLEVEIYDPATWWSHGEKEQVLRLVDRTLV